MNPINLLTPGTVWARTRQGKTRYTTVVNVTNTHLTGKMLEQNPPQVIFVDAQGRWSSMDAARFMRTRTLEDTNHLVLANVEELFSSKAATQEVSSPIAKVMEASVAEQSQQEETGNIRILLDVSTEEQESYLDVTSEIVAYSTRPMFGTSSTVHEIIFAPDSKAMQEIPEDIKGIQVSGKDIIVSEVQKHKLISKQTPDQELTKDDVLDTLYLEEKGGEALPLVEEVEEVKEQEQQEEQEVEVESVEEEQAENKTSEELLAEIKYYQELLRQRDAVEVTEEVEPSNEETEEVETVSVPVEVDILVHPDVTPEVEVVEGLVTETSTGDTATLKEEVVTQVQEAPPAQEGIRAKLS